MNKYSIFLYDSSFQPPLETIWKKKNCLTKCFSVVGFARWNVRSSVHQYISKVFLGVIFKLSQRENIQAPPGPPAHGGDSKKMPEATHNIHLCETQILRQMTPRRPHAPQFGFGPAGEISNRCSVNYSERYVVPLTTSLRQLTAVMGWLSWLQSEEWWEDGERRQEKKERERGRKGGEEDETDQESQISEWISGFDYNDQKGKCDCHR